MEDLDVFFFHRIPSCFLLLLPQKARGFSYSYSTDDIEVFFFFHRRPRGLLLPPRKTWGFSFSFTEDLKVFFSFNRKPGSFPLIPQMLGGFFLFHGRPGILGLFMVFFLGKTIRSSAIEVPKNIRSSLVFYAIFMSKKTISYSAIKDHKVLHHKRP